ncbi:MAG TPA: ArsR family transcriptional regulator [Gemmatimonadaceae bacterium]
MLLTRWSQKFYESTRGRIVALLRRASLTVDQIAGTLGLTGNAVRAHLATLERDGVVEQRVAKRGGVGKPAYAYSITEDAERLFSRAYVPILAQLLDALGEHMSRQELDALMQSVGHRLAAAQHIPAGSPRERVATAARLLNDLGGITDVEERDGALRIRGYACPLGAAVRGHPEVCGAVETMLSDVVGAPVRERCERGDRPKCCFEIAAAAARDGDG